MIITFTPSIAKGTISAPPSKSYAHRFLIATSLAGGGKLKNISHSNDIDATINCLKSLSYECKFNADEVIVTPSTYSSDIYDANESGSTLRFMIPIIHVKRAKSQIFASKRLFIRGLDVYEKIFDKLKMQYHYEANSILIKGMLEAGNYKVDASISSQFISGLLFALPLLNGDSVIKTIHEISSEPYIDMTIDVLNKYGIEINRNKNIFHIKGNQTYIQKETFEIEGDYSNASFLDALNLIGGNVNISNLNPDSKQGDKIYRYYFNLLKEGHPSINIDNSIDLGPILFVVASLFNGAVFTGIRRLRIKESDRVKDMLAILKEFGVIYVENEDRLEIFPSILHAPDKLIKPANDHRLIMAASILLTKFGGSMDNIEAVNKSYPNFFNDLKSLGVKYEIK